MAKFKLTKTIVDAARPQAGERRKPSLGLFGELTVEQARLLAQDWLAEVRCGGEPSDCSERCSRTCR